MKILVVDDEELLVKGIRFNLQNEGYEVITGADGLDAIRLVGDPDKMVKKVGLCTGAGVSFTALAAAKGCDAYLTGDIKYHEAQDAIEKGIGVVDVTHYASEVLIVPVLQK